MAIIGLNQLHPPLVACRTRITGFAPSAFAIGLQGGLAVRCRMRHQGVGALPQQGATVSQLGLTVTIGKRAELANLVQATGQDMQGESA